MLVLAVETSGPTGSLALGQFAHHQLQNIWSVQWTKKAIHSEMATVQLTKLFQTAGRPISDLSHVIVDAGPGSFTGIRVGLNLARTLAYTLAIPIASVTSLDLHAARLGKVGDRVFVAIRAIQNFYYAAGYELTPQGWKVLHPPLSVEESDLPQLSTNFTKVGIEGEAPGLPHELSADTILRCLDQWPDGIRFFTWKDVRPIYIRASEAEEKLLKGLPKREF